MSLNLTPEQEIQVALQWAERMKASGANPGISPTGPNGLFNTPGLEPGIPTTYVPPFGVESFLETAGHVRVSDYTNPVFGIITGQTASTGDEPTTPCDENVPVAGNLKLCQQMWQFGEFTMKSQVIRIDNQGELINRGSPINLNLINDPFNEGVAQQITPMDPAAIFRNTMAKLTLELANDFKRRYAPLIWTGDPANTAGSSGGYLQYNGLQKIVNTGYRDVTTGIACPASDSLVKDLNNAIVQNNTIATVRMFVETYRDRLYLSDLIQFGQVNYAWVMTYQMFLALTEIWPCAYYTYRCYAASPTGNTSVMLDAGQQVAMRDDMRANRYLLIDGQRVPVIIDNVITETNTGNGNFSSEAYLLPLSAPGKYSDTNGQLLYMEYFNYRGPFGMASTMNAIGPDNIYKVSADGRFIAMLMAPNSFCRQIQMRTRKRIVLRTPFLAARIQNVQYAVYQHERTPMPGTSFYANGGATSFAGPSFFTPTGA